MPFLFNDSDIKDVVIIEPKVFEDERGSFSEIYKSSDFEDSGVKGPIVQANHSKSQKNVIRGLHYQLNPFAQGKIVRAIVGEIFDVAVDLRKGSSSFGKWVGETLTNENRKMLYVPQGFAHGFSVLSEVAEVVYYCTESEYSPESERGIVFNDSFLNIDWMVENPSVLEKDLQLPSFAEAEMNFQYE